MAVRTNVGRPLDVEVKKTKAKTEHLVERVKAWLVYFLLGPGTIAVLSTLAFGFFMGDYQYFYAVTAAYGIGWAAVMRHYFQTKRTDDSD